MSNLRLINETTATDGVLSVTVTDLFSEDFDIYQITFSDFQSNGAFGLDFRFVNTSGSEISASNYDRAKYYMPAYTSFGEVRATNQNYIDRFIDMAGYSATGQSSFGTCYVFNPYSNSSYTFYIAQGGLVGSNTSLTKSIGVLKNTDRVGGIKVYSDDGVDTFKTLKIRTYGLRVDS